MSKHLFSNLNLPKELTDNLETLGYKEMTEIQAKSLPVLLEGKDVTAQAKTGSGKTAAFGISLVYSLDPDSKDPSSLVLCPTRELADQVATELKRLARFSHNIKIITLCGGTPIMPQVRSLEHGANIIVGTPGRVKDHIERANFKLKTIKSYVLDEADRMLDMGFKDDIEFITKRLPQKRQTMLFSATYPPEIDTIAKDYLVNPKMIVAETVHEEHKIKQIFIDTEDQKKYHVLLNALSEYGIDNAMVFCRTKKQCDELSEKLNKEGYFSEAIHGDLEQKDRNEVLAMFSNGSLHLLVSTDVAARGIDIKSLGAVVNYDISKDPSVHVHKIGRTGRADEEGLALTLYSEKELHMVTAIEDHLNIFVDKVSAKDLKPHQKPDEPKMATLLIGAGKKAKLRPGDILGAITKDGKFEGSQVGNIKIFPWHSYVAVERRLAGKILNHLKNNKIKGKNIKPHLLD